MAKLLLVEDDNNLREIYAARLEAEGHEVHAAADGEEALATAVKVVPDLVILDVMMPKISGFDVLDILRSTPETKSAKIIMMTALSQQTDKERGERLGTDKYLIKSQVTLEDVVNTVNELLGAPTSAPTPQPAPAPAEPPVGVPENELNSAMANSPAPQPATEPAAAPPAPAPAPAAEPVADTPAPQPAAEPPTPAPAVTPEPIPEPTRPAQDAAADPAPDPKAEPAAQPAPATTNGLVVEETDDQNIQEPSVEKTMEDGNPENDNPSGLATAQADESADINKQIEVLTSAADTTSTPKAPEPTPEPTQAPVEAEPAQDQAEATPTEAQQPTPEEILAAVDSVETPAPQPEATPQDSVEPAEAVAEEPAPSGLQNGVMTPPPPSEDTAQSVLGPEHLNEESTPAPLPGDSIHPQGTAENDDVA